MSLREGGTTTKQSYLRDFHVPLRSVRNHLNSHASILLLLFLVKMLLSLIFISFSLTFMRDRVWLSM